MKLFRIGLVIALIGTLALFAIPQFTQAQGGGFSVSYNFHTSDGGWAGYTTSCTATYSSGNGWQSCTNGAGAQADYVYLVWPSGTAHITHIRLIYSFSANTATDTGDDIFRSWSGTSVGSGTLGCDVNDTALDTPGAYINRTFDIDVSCSNARTWLFGTNSLGAITLQEIDITGDSGSPFTPTPTFTPTPLSLPGLPAAANYDSCPLMGDSNANLSDTSRWNLVLGATQATPNGIDFGTNTGSSPGQTGYAYQMMTLSRYTKYVVTLKYKQTTDASDQSFLFRLGLTEPLTITLASGTDEQTTTFDAANYEPSQLGAADQYLLTVESWEIDPGNDIIVTYVCISDESNKTSNSLGATGADATALSSLCKSCTYDPGTISGLGDIINNIVKLLQWLWCGFSQIWDCSVRPFFATLLAIIGVIISAIAFIRQWAAIILANGNEWIGAVIPVLWHFISGFIINLIQAVLNAAATLARSLGLDGLFNFIVSLLGNASNIFTLIADWVRLAIQQILNVLSAIPTLFNALISGYNQSATSTGATAPVCNDTSSMLYGPCLGLYVLDNTIFAGPMFYAIPVALGLVAFNTILWAMQEIRGALTK